MPQRRFQLLVAERVAQVPYAVGRDPLVGLDDLAGALPAQQQRGPDARDRHGSRAVEHPGQGGGVLPGIHRMRRDGVHRLAEWLANERGHQLQPDLRLESAAG